MSVDLSTLSLYPATPEQKIEARRRTQHEWGRGLTLEEHLARDAAQEEMEGSLGGKFITWVLVPRESPTSMDIKCACETFARTGLVYEPSDNSTKTVPCYAIASVFTPAEHRGKGFARHMMRLMHWVLADESFLPNDAFPSAKWGAPPPKVDGLRNGWFSALWSDVGTLYASCGPFPGQEGGWVIRGTTTALWDVHALPSLESDGAWTWLDNAGVSKLWEEDSELIRNELPASNHLSIAFTPEVGVASFQHRRLDIYLDKVKDRPQTWGVVSADRGTYATWTIDPRPPVVRMTITRLRTTRDAFPGVFAKVVELARRHDVKTIEVWGLSEELLAGAKELGAKVSEREEHLSAFKWYGKGTEEDIQWAFNERFAWC
ncbi:hypothetical protein MKEN_00759300 [Mycena kentingensis (nom. inval.)]|nr:hypothetical protein MKEN_00759300 [Mycena kentingensis (nom. inval.)]